MKRLGKRIIKYCQECAGQYFDENEGKRYCAKHGEREVSTYKGTIPGWCTLETVKEKNA